MDHQGPGTHCSLHQSGCFVQGGELLVSGLHCLMPNKLSSFYNESCLNCHIRFIITVQFYMGTVWYVMSKLWSCCFCIKGSIMYKMYMQFGKRVPSNKYFIESRFDDVMLQKRSPWTIHLTEVMILALRLHSTYYYLHHVIGLSSAGTHYGRC